MARAEHDVVVVGGGPVGLCLAVLLARRGADVVILEARPERTNHSRAIGIHPPGLRVLAAAGVADTLASEGVTIRDGVARSAGREVAILAFDPAVLAVPQWRTEAALEARLAELAPAALRRGVRAVGLGRQRQGSAVVHAVDATGGELAFEGRWVVAADGARSSLRAALGVRVQERTYPDAYVMGDFADTSGDDTAAVLYLEPEGIIESFPLPGGVRRWVAHTDTLVTDPSAERLAALISHRTRARVDPTTNTMLSAFTVRERLATAMMRERVLLVGDAAHEVSPIGGQGMTLGWLDAEAFAPLLASGEHETWPELWAAVEGERRREAAEAARHAALNMALGRPLPPRLMAARNAAFRGLYRTRAARSWTARRFTMQS